MNAGGNEAWRQMTMGEVFALCSPSVDPVRLAVGLLNGSREAADLLDRLTRVDVQHAH